MTLIALTGASGNLGTAAADSLLRDPENRLRVLLRDSRRGKKAARRLLRRYGDRAEVLFGTVTKREDCARLTRDAEYLIHLAVLIPPAADRDPERTLRTNARGTENLVRAVLENGGNTKFIHISTVAVYGGRTEKHPWGRVGDPLVTSAFDVYGQSKTAAEYAVLESGLPCWVILRQTAVLYDDLLLSNISDGLLFHTPWDAPIEWVTAADTAVLLSRIVSRDLKGENGNFWRRVYNIGGGEKARQTGYQTFEDGFRLIGGSVKDFFEPNWNAARNFHCFWFSDSDELESRFSFRSQGCKEFWDWYKKRHRVYALAGLLPKRLLRKLFIERLLKSPSAPLYWVEHGDEARLLAFFGGRKGWEALPGSWEDARLFCESPEYERIRSDPAFGRLDHGYDETKEDSLLSIADMRQAAAFRGGECVSCSMVPGDLYTKLTWRCHEGHEFEASPYTVLKAGHWCPECFLAPMVWQTDRVARHSPFHAQVWLDSHDPQESFIYRLENGRATVEDGE